MLQQEQQRLIKSFELGVKPPGARDQDEEKKDNDNGIQKKSKTTTGAVVGIVIGVVAAIVIIIIIYIKCHKRKSGNQSSANTHVTQVPPAATVPPGSQVQYSPYGQPNATNEPSFDPSMAPPPYSAVAVGHYDNPHASAPPYNPAYR